MRLLISALIIFYASQAWATVYWASPTGSNSATCTNIDSVGTADSPGADPGSYGTIGRAANCATVAGDVVNIKAGTYTSVNDRIKTDAETTGLKSGTSESVRTYLQGDPSGAKPQINYPNWFQIYDTAASESRSYITIRHVSVSGSGGGDTGGCEFNVAGKFITVDDVEITSPYNVHICAFRHAGSQGIDHIVIKNSSMHGQAGDGNGKCVYINGDDVTVEHNVCYDTKGGAFQLLGSGSVAGDSNRAVIRYNHVYDVFKATQDGYVNTCEGLTLDGSNVLVYNNIIDGTGCQNQGGGSGSGVASGYSATASAKVYNNIIINWPTDGVQMGIFVTGGTSGNETKNNIILGNGTAITLYNGSSNTTATNKTTGSLTDCVVSSSDYRHKAGSSCIDAGTAIVGYNYNGSAPDQGPFETFVFATCSVENGDASNLRVTFTNNVAPPLLPTNPTGFTARKAGVNDVITARTRVGDNRIDLTLTDAIVAGNAVDVSYSGGDLTDSALIGDTLNQTYVQSLTNQSCTNNVGGAPTFTFTQSVFEFHGLRGTEAAPVMKPDGVASSGAAENIANMDVMVGGSIRLRISVLCGTADCPATGFYPRYSKNGGLYSNVVPDTFGADNIAFCGTGPDTDIPTNGTATTNQLSGGTGFVAGALVRTSNAIPTVDLDHTTNTKVELEYCFSFDTDTTANDTYDIRIYQQDGTALNTYTNTPRMTVVGAAGGSGFSQLDNCLASHDQMLASLTRVEELLTPPDSNFSVDYLSKDQVYLEGLDCTSLKTTGSGTRRTVTCLH